MTQLRSIKEINAKIAKGQAVVVTAEEVLALVAEHGVEETARRVDVVTTGTFGPMCSSGAVLNVGHATPRMRMTKVHLNGVNAYAGLAAVDVYLGATEIPETDPANSSHPGEFNYGGAHVIEDLVAGKPVLLEASSYGTDCYPRQQLKKQITLAEMNEAYLFNPRNCYQNYNVAVNLTERTIYTYMGILKPQMGNANYSSAGQLSPLLNDPYYRTLGIGTKLFLGGGIGYVAWQGTQHSPNAPRSANGVPRAGAGTLALIGDLKQMNTRYLRGVSLLGYGVSMQVGVGLPIPILDAETLSYAAVRDEDIMAQVVDYGEAYPQGVGGSLAEVSYAELKSGTIVVQGKEVPTAPMSSYPRAREIAQTLKQWITKGEFTLTEPVAALPTVEAE
ncbi:MAG TPA: homocysteine biosynthesis protein [Oscillospiraceae bacterium]|nr:homocysteine biosynthesis protein [Oscillospiraceae bacterium]